MTRRSPIINRRAFLYGAGTAGVALPFLEGMPERSAFAAGETPSFGFFICTAHGVVQEQFWPESTGAFTTASLATESSQAASELADHADRLLFVEGVNYPSVGLNCGHAQGLAMCLTGRASSGGRGATGAGPSADTIIADSLGVEPLTLYAGVKEGYIDEKLSFSAAGKVRGAEGNPFNTYERLAGLIDTSTGVPTGMGMDLVARSKSVNDLIRGDLNSLRSRKELSQADKQRLDLHFSTIRDLEEGMVQAGLACSDAELDMTALKEVDEQGTKRAYIEDVAKFQMELVGLAFACNFTQVATLQCGDGTDKSVYEDADGNRLEPFHHISHRINGDGNQGSQISGAVEKHAYIDRIRLRTFKILLEKWEQFSTPDGLLLDNAFALWTSHVSTGPDHGFRNLPMIIAGNAGGYLKQGQYVDAGGVSNADLLRTLINACGAEGAGFAGGEDGISALLA